MHPRGKSARNVIIPVVGMTRPSDYFSIEILRADLKGKTLRGGLYTATAQVLIVLINLAAIPRRVFPRVHRVCSRHERPGLSAWGIVGRRNA